MQVKYPHAIFNRYFAFLAACPVRVTGKAYRHHIAPREQFPELDKHPDNIIRLSLARHRQAHFILSFAIPDAAMPTPRFIAAARYGGSMGGKEAVRRRVGIHAPGMQSKAAQAGGRKIVKLRRGIFTPGWLQKGIGGRIGGPLGGVKGGRKTYQLQIGIHAPGMAALGGTISGIAMSQQGKGMFAPARVGYGLHHRWHLNRAIVKSGCRFCIRKRK